MEPRLTEFSYGFCVTEEFANGVDAGLKAAPYFPSLYAEGKLGGGFDVQIGSALFLQFKLADELTRRSARETKLGLLEPPFFRFSLHRRDLSNQHQMLIELEGEVGNQVYYIAPSFAVISELDKAFQAKEVVVRSLMFSPTEIGPLPDDKYHNVSFSAGADSGWFLSKPKRIAAHRSREVLRRAFKQPIALEGGDSLEWLYEMAVKMRRIVRRFDGSAKLSDSRADVFPRHDLLMQVAYLARTHFGCELFVPAKPK